MAIADLLAASRAANLQRKHAAGRVDRKGVVVSVPDYQRAETQAAEALRLRREAQAQDPEFVDPAWAQDAAINGCDHAQMVRFLERYAEIP